MTTMTYDPKFKVNAVEEIMKRLGVTAEIGQEHFDEMMKQGILNPGVHDTPRKVREAIYAYVKDNGLLNREPNELDTYFDGTPEPAPETKEALSPQKWEQAALTVICNVMKVGKNVAITRLQSYLAEGILDPEIHTRPELMVEALAAITQPAQEPAKQETSKPEAQPAPGVHDTKRSMIPVSGQPMARLWRRYGDEDVEFFIAAPNAVLLMGELDILYENTEPATWLAEKRQRAEMSKPKLGEGLIYTYEGFKTIVTIKAKEDRYEGRKRLKLEFWSASEKRLQAEFAPLLDSDAAYWTETKGRKYTIREAVAECLKVQVGNNFDLEGKFKLTVRLGRLGTYSKDVVSDSGTIVHRKGDSKNPNYPNSYWQDFVSIERIQD